ncbi:MFS transporter [Bosea minatitlanensis]|uniref:MFS transporter n=1 Tax=Bosea minatitlanensis TaxID=128782 RepID=A0ABW0F6X8_9HYPH|nr:MFS transporter [Bosea minatitlanensis]MCT4493408.1 MFS transporter [Bosea minatitlanensis]
MATTFTSTASAGAKPSNIRWRVVALMFVLYTINCIDRIALSVGLPVIGKEFELSPAMQGLILSAFFWTYCGFQIPGGWAADRWGGRRVLGWSTALWGSFQCLAAAAVGGISMMLTRIGLGVFEAPYMPTASKLVAAWLPPTERSRGITLIDSGAPLGSAFGGLIISSLIVFFDSWRLAFLCVGVLTLLFGAYVIWQLRNRPDEHPEVNPAELAVIAAKSEAVADDDGKRRMSGRTFAAMIVGRIGWTMIFFGLVTWGPNYLSSARGFDLKAMGYATFVIFAAGAVGAVFAGTLADWLQKHLPRDLAFKVLFGLSGLVALGGLLALPYVSDAVTAVALLAVTVLFHFFGSLYWTIPAMLAPRERIGLVGGVMNFAGTSSGIAAPILIGFLVQWTGGFDAVITYFTGCAVVYLIGSLLIDFRPAQAAAGRAAA